MGSLLSRRGLDAGWAKLGLRTGLVVGFLVALAVPAVAGPGFREPHIAYLFPAGWQRGNVIRVWCGGQYLGGMDRVHVSGKGVRGRVLFYAPPLNSEDFDELRRRRAARGNQPATALQASAGQGTEGKKWNPLIDLLDELNPLELQTVLGDFFSPNTKRQPNAQISDTAFLEFTIDPDAEPGDREVRIGTPNGLTNAMLFQVGVSPEVYEVQPFGVIKRPTPVLEPPVVINGQCTPGDVDRFRIRARRGQRLVFQVFARHLNPYLADAVPGWFQALIALHDARGQQVAFADDDHFDPDPVLLYEVPEDGEYTLEIRDALYRGREDFVYRVQVSEQPFITRIFPLGGREGTDVNVLLGGWNLAAKAARLDTRPGHDEIRRLALPAGTGARHHLAYAVNTLPEVFEEEPNDTRKEARRVTLPVIVNGVISRPGDVDCYQFRGRAGETVVAAINARALGSPLDSLVRLSDAGGRVLVWNDDHPDPALGLLAHHADSYLSARLPKDGDYLVSITDTARQGEEAFGYRLRIGPPQPDFALRVAPASVNLPGSGILPLTVRAVRRDGFTGAIELALNDPPAGFRLGGAWVPPGRDTVRVTLSAPGGVPGEPVALRIEGRARIGDAVVTRVAVPAQEMEQAFAYWHLVPRQELLVDATRVRGAAPAEVVGAVPIRVPAGGSAQARVKVPWRWALPNVELEPNEPPKGITVGHAMALAGDLAFAIKADATAVKPGDADNLIIEAFARQRDGRRSSLGFLPAIPIEVVPRTGHGVSMRRSPGRHTARGKRRPAVPAPYGMRHHERV
jgi:hypothetical protein